MVEYFIVKMDEYTFVYERVQVVKAIVREAMNDNPTAMLCRNTFEENIFYMERSLNLNRSLKTTMFIPSQHNLSCLFSYSLFSPSFNYRLFFKSCDECVYKLYTIPIQSITNIIIKMYTILIVYYSVTLLTSLLPYLLELLLPSPTIYVSGQTYLHTWVDRQCMHVQPSNYSRTRRDIHIYIYMYLCPHSQFLH